MLKFKKVLHRITEYHIFTVLKLNKMKNFILEKREKQTEYTLGRFKSKATEMVLYIKFDTFSIQFNSFVSDLFNMSKDRDFKNECDSIRKSKSLNKKQKFVNENIDKWESVYYQYL